MMLSLSKDIKFKHRGRNFTATVLAHCFYDDHSQFVIDEYEIMEFGFSDNLEENPNEDDYEILMTIADTKDWQSQYDEECQWLDSHYNCQDCYD